MILIIVAEQAEVFPVDLKLDYKPRRVDYRALRDGKTIELMNFFHFDGAEMTLRHIVLRGVSTRNHLAHIVSEHLPRSRVGPDSSTFSTIFGRQTSRLPNLSMSFPVLLLYARSSMLVPALRISSYFL